MSSVYERLIALFDAVGLKTNQGSYSEAEAYALSVGIEPVKAYIESVKAVIFFPLNAGAPKPYADMLSLKYDKAEPETLTQCVISRLSSDYGSLCSYEEFESERSLLLGEAELSYQSGGYTVSNLTPSALFFLRSFIGGAAVCGIPISLSGGGLTFSEWDEVGETFRAYDSLRLPFSCIDTLTDGLL